MALIQCPQCIKEISDQAEACPGCGHPIKEKEASAAPMPVAGPKVLACPACNIQLIQKEKKASVSVAGIAGAFLFLIGFVVIFFNPIFGIILMVSGVIIGIVGRSKKIVMICPKCGKAGATVAA